MNKATLKKFKTLLTDKRDEILKKAKQTLEQDMTLDTDDLPDEMDLASSEYLQSFTFRLRGREKSFLDKIEKALAQDRRRHLRHLRRVRRGNLRQAPRGPPGDDALHPLQGRPGADGEGLHLTESRGARSAARRKRWGPARVQPRAARFGAGVARLSTSRM